MNADVKAIVDYSCLATDYLVKLLQSQYGLPLELDVRFWYQGLNDTYAVRSVQGNYMLRIYRHNWRSMSEIKAELALIRQGNTTEVRLVAPAHADVSGNRVQSIEAPEGTRHAVLFHWAEGAIGTPKDERLAVLAGRGLATLHKRWDQLSQNLVRPHFDRSFLLDRPMEVYRYYASESPQLMSRLAGLEQALAPCFEVLQQADAAFGLCHGDMHGGNMACGDQGVILFDLDFAGYGPRVWDLVCFYQTLIDESCSKGKMIWQAFVDAYDRQLGVSEGQRKLIPVLAAIRRFWGYGLRMANLRGRPSFWLCPSYLEGCIAEVEQWLAGKKLLR